MKYEIISTGSSGNCVILGGNICIDIGVSFKAVKPYVRGLKLLLLTHAHSDHINTKTLKRVVKERPTLRIGCCEWMMPKLDEAGIPKKNIDVYEIGKTNRYTLFDITPVKLYHNAPNCGYRIFVGNEKIFYATDTGHLEGITARNYSLYMIECNYTDEDIARRIEEKEQNGEYAYEHEVKYNHLSKTQCDEFIANNAGRHSKYVYLHQHSDKHPERKRRRFEI